MQVLCELDQLRASQGACPVLIDSPQGYRLQEDLTQALGK